MINKEQLISQLQTKFGFSEFRAGQIEAIQALLEHDRLLCIQPTGHGKSLLYQLPAILLPGITLVISPLLALMRDQLHHLNTRFKIPAASINSDQTEQENFLAQNMAKENRIKILFVAPEQLDDVERFEFILNLSISLVVVDEAHCISTWGHDFRPSYRQIVQLVKAVAHKNPHTKILGLTATANSKTEADIKAQFDIENKAVVVHRASMDRPNIQLSVVQIKGIDNKLALLEQLLTQLQGTGLIYCATRENTELVAEYLQTKKVNIIAYHAGIIAEQKRALQENFIANKYRVIAATNALGMGIDKADLRFIIHFDTPGSITAYYQEVGRAGRDGLPAHGILLFDPADKKIQQYFIEAAQPGKDDFAKILTEVKTAPAPPNLTTIKRMVGLHPTLVTVMLAELVEQGFLHKSKQNGSQVYQLTSKHGPLDLARYQNQYAVKTNELKMMLDYAAQNTHCRMLTLRQILGDTVVNNCNHCDNCTQLPFKLNIDTEHITTIADWLAHKTIVTNAVATNKISTGVALLDGKLRSPLFVRFMQNRQHSSEIVPELIDLIHEQLKLLQKEHKFGSVIVIPSLTWASRNSAAQEIAKYLQVPALLNLLQWQGTPAKRQGELLNNDQRRFNVDRKIRINFQQTIPKGAILLLDDYTGSGATIKEAARALRKNANCNEAIVPFTIAALKWKLGAPGMV